MALKCTGFLYFPMESDIKNFGKSKFYVFNRRDEEHYCDKKNCSTVILEPYCLPVILNFDVYK